MESWLCPHTSEPISIVDSRAFSWRGIIHINFQVGIQPDPFSSITIITCKNKKDDIYQIAKSSTHGFRLCKFPQCCILTSTLDHHLHKFLDTFLLGHDCYSRVDSIHIEKHCQPKQQCPSTGWDANMDSSLSPRGIQGRDDCH